jgi:Holliday junction resolvasome RuvABC DNA-binding subunit
VVATSVSGRGSESWRSAVAAALTSLGWSPREAEAAVDQLASRLSDVTDPDAPDVGVLLKEALRSLDRS